MAQRGPYRIYPAAPRARALRLLTTFVLTPRDLSCALDISIYHASLTLRRLWEQGYCTRWPYRDRSYRYRLHEKYLCPTNR